MPREEQQPLLNTAQPTRTASSSYFKARRAAYGMVEGTIDSYFEYSMLLLILLNVISFIIGTVIVDGTFEDGVCVKNCIDLNTQFDKSFEMFEFISVVIFTFEYALRIWSSMENPLYSLKGPMKGRVAYGLSFFCIVDLISILPYWLNLLGLIAEVEFTTAIRMFRLVRLLKADKYLNAFSLLGTVLFENGPLLLATSYYAVLTLVVSASLLHFSERNNPELAKYFQSIPHAMFPTILMLTGEFPL